MSLGKKKLSTYFMSFLTTVRERRISGNLESNQVGWYEKLGNNSWKKMTKLCFSWLIWRICVVVVC